METQSKAIRRVDLMSGLFVTALGAGALVEAYNMPRYESRGVDPYTVPGVTPGLVSAVLLIFGLLLAFRALRGGGTGAGVTIHQWDKGAVLRIGATLGLTLAYGLLLFGNVPFVAATTVFIFSFVFAMEAINPDRKLSLPMVGIAALALALVAAFGIDFVFRELFLVRFPG